MDIQNFTYGIHAISRGMSDTLQLVTNYPMFWGFAMGFLVATLMHGFLISGDPRDVPTMLLKDKSISFEILNKRGSEGAYTQSFSEFGATVDKIKFVFSVAVLIFVTVVVIAMLRF